MKHRRILSALLCAAMLLSLCVTGAAAVEENYDTFDYRAYANIYPDLKAAYGYNAEKLYAHYVNYGKAEGRVGTFISGDNPKTNAPIYGVPPIPAGATLPATLLDPLPPKDPSKQAKWSEETTNYLSWSNAKLVAEYYSMKSIMDGDQRWDYLTDITVYYWQSTLPEELQDRYDAVVENDPNFFSTHGDVYGRAMQSDTRILYQFFNGYKDFAPPPRRSRQGGPEAHGHRGRLQRRAGDRLLRKACCLGRGEEDHRWHQRLCFLPRQHLHPGADPDLPVALPGFPRAGGHRGNGGL